MLGATGAVGHHTATTLATHPSVARLTLLGRRPAPDISGPVVAQHTVDIFDAAAYDGVLDGHDAAICTLGVGQPSQMSKDEFIRIDRDAVITFATACKHAGVRHFSLLSSVGVDANSKSFYLRTKGELEQALIELQFERLSLFHPSMILTPINRYGFSQALVLTFFPLLTPILAGPLRKYRGIKVDTLGKSIAVNVLNDLHGVETLHWDEFVRLAPA